jgi:cytosine/adenosine deaminase-related metal-dependent hydrolase
MKASTIGAETAVEMATIHGARAMGLDNEIGSLEVGKKADMIAFNLQQISLTPQHDIVSNLVFSSNGQNVDTVLVDGEELVVDGKIVTVDVQEVIEETLIRAPEVARRASLTRDSRWPVS